MRGAERGAALTQRMLAFARQQELVTCSANIRELVANTRELIRRSIGPQIVLDDDEVSAELPPVKVDPVQFELAMLNLAINARDAMPHGGRIEIRAGSARLPASATAKAGSYVWIEVADSGSGMASETLDRATEPFFSTKPTGKGTGLGLSMVRGFVEQLGGMLTISSEVGAGTKVRLWFPEADEPAAKAETGADAAPPAQAQATILLVDDDSLIASSTKLLLEAIGHSVIDVDSAESAIEVLERNAPIDLIMTDYAMPGMTGLELASYVRRFRPELPVLLVTGFADLPNAPLPSVARLSKPYRQAQLEEKLASLLAK
jgi:CheY-like chemotaxis protein